MPLSFFLQMTMTAVITVWSPGPNNIMLLSTASRYGIRRNLRFMAGIWTGSLTLMLLSGLLCSTLASVVPGIQPVMRWVGALYLLYLAWGTLRRQPPGEEEVSREPTYWMGFLLQMVNVKIILYGLTMFSSFILPYVQAPFLLLLFAVYLMFLGALGNLIWAAAGNVLKKFYAAHYRLMNVLMALLVVWCALRIVGV